MSKKHAATSQKLRKAREDGNSGASTYATSAVAFVVAVAVLPMAARGATERTIKLFQVALREAAAPTPQMAIAPGALAVELLAMVVPLLAAVAATAAVVGGVQAGGTFSFKKLAPKLPNLFNFKNLFSTTRLITVGRALIAAGVVSYLAYRGLRAHVAELVNTAGHVAYIVPVASKIALGIVWSVALVGLGLGAADALITKMKWRTDLMMTDEEVKQEHKDQDGDPHLKHERAKAHKEWMNAAAINQVKNAKVVLINPTHLAVALRYNAEDGDEAPMIVSSGEGELAEQIKKAAQQYGVPIVQNIPLARALIEFPLGEAIPEDLYTAVATVLSEIAKAEVVS